MNHHVIILFVQQERNKQITMATTTATLTLASTDLLTDSLSLVSAATLTNAGGSTGMTQTTGLSRKNIAHASAAAIGSTVLFRGDDYTTNGANKVYIKNCSSTAAEYITVHFSHTDTDGMTEIGRLYAGDWMFMPWGAAGGTKSSFITTIANTWAANDTFEFDGVTIVAANSTANDIAAQIHAAHFPNWTTSVSGAAVTFTARTSQADGAVTGATAVTGLAISVAGDGTAAITSGTVGATSVSDIIIVPSVHTGILVEHMLMHE